MNATEIPSTYPARFAAHVTAVRRAATQPEVDWDAYRDDLDGQLVCGFADWDGVEYGCLADWPWIPLAARWSGADDAYVPVVQS